jgi:hypothetical protein
MKTDKRIQKDIDDIIFEINAKKECEGLTQRFLNSSRNKIALYRRLIIHLETKPSEKFVKKELADTIKKIEHIENSFEDWKNNTPGINNIKDKKAFYYNESGIKKLKELKENLEYLLS